MSANSLINDKENNLNQNVIKEIENSSLFIIKQKRDRFRNDIRKTEIDSCLNNKRNKYCAPKTNVQNSSENQEDEYHDIKPTLLLFKDAVKNGENPEILSLLLQIKKTCERESVYFLSELKQNSILTELKELLSESYDNEEEIQISTISLFSQLVALDEIGYIASYIYKYKLEIKSLKFFQSKSEKNLEIILWSLTNFTNDSNELRLSLLENNITSLILNLYENQERDIKILRESLFLISNLCKGNPYPEYKYICPFLPLLDGCISIEDTNVLESTMWALSYLSDVDNDKIKNILRLNKTSRIINLSLHPNENISLPSLRTISNILSSDDEDVEILLQNGLLDSFWINIDSTNKIMKREVTWGISNLLACNQFIIDAVFEHKIIDKIFTHAFYDEHKVRVDLVIGLVNSILKGNKNQIFNLIDRDVIHLFCQMLEIVDSKTINHILNALDILLKLGDELETYNYNPIKNKMEESGLNDILSELQYHPDLEVYKNIINLVEKHFHL